MAKKRTQAKFINAVISGIRTAFARYSPKYETVLKLSRVEADRYNKDGSVSKVPDVGYKCNICSQVAKKVDIDHIDPVIPADKARSDMAIGEILNRIDCDIDNLQVICESCHDLKTTEERKLRKSLKKG